MIRSPQAERDLEDILDYLDRHRPRAADRSAMRIDEKAAIHAQFPEMGRDRRIFGDGLGSFLADSYVVFYRPSGDGIEIIRIIHGLRDLPAMFEEIRAAERLNFPAPPRRPRPAWPPA